MKLLSIAIPCYNSQDYMENCIESLLVGGEEVEILIVDDGSSDRTAEIADDYARKYPTIVKAIHQENGGHGEAVNAGIRNATGLYFKVVDSDDWVNKEAYVQILKTLYELLRGPQTVDLLISNFVYEKGEASSFIGTKKIGGERSGTGDVFTGIITGSIVRGDSLTTSVRKAVDFIGKALAYTETLNLPPAQGIAFEEFLTEL